MKAPSRSTLSPKGERDNVEPPALCPKGERVLNAGLGSKCLSASPADLRPTRQGRGDQEEVDARPVVLRVTFVG